MRLCMYRRTRAWYAIKKKKQIRQYCNVYNTENLIKTVRTAKRISARRRIIRIPGPFIYFIFYRVLIGTFLQSATDLHISDWSISNGPLFYLYKL